MRDSECQASFIAEELAQRVGLPVLKIDLQLKVHGFNTSQIYHTKAYKANLAFGDQVHGIEVIGVPSIKTCMTLPGFNTLVHGFKGKGYQLADRFLFNGKDQIGNINFILGCDFAYCLQEKFVQFGQSSNTAPSVYSKTPAGIMLIGNVGQMIQNLSYLPQSSSKSVEEKTLNVMETSIESKFVTCQSLGLSNSSNNIAEEFLMELTANFVVLDEKGEVMESELQKATKEMLEQSCSNMLDYDKESFSEDNVESNQKIINYVLNNTTYNNEGRLVMPLIWNNKVDHLLGKKQTSSIANIKV